MKEKRKDLILVFELEFNGKTYRRTEHLNPKEGQPSIKWERQLPGWQSTEWEPVYRSESELVLEEEFKQTKMYEASRWLGL